MDMKVSTVKTQGDHNYDRELSLSCNKNRMTLLRKKP
jgi:hypothetical protein